MLLGGYLYQSTQQHKYVLSIKKWATACLNPLLAIEYKTIYFFIIILSLGNEQTYNQIIRNDQDIFGTLLSAFYNLSAFTLTFRVFFVCSLDLQPSRMSAVRADTAFINYRRQKQFYRRRSRRCRKRERDALFNDFDCERADKL